MVQKAFRPCSILYNLHMHKHFSRNLKKRLLVGAMVYNEYTKRMILFHKEAGPDVTHIVSSLKD